MKFTALVAALCAIAAACSTTPATQVPRGNSEVQAVDRRIEQIQDAVDSWRDAATLGAAQAAAEEARNLVTGPGVEGYGDLDQDRKISGDVERGLLPDERTAPGLALALSDCAGPDLLGGSWADQSARWVTLRDAISAWTPTNNTFSGLPSHPQRVVGWATLTLRTNDLDLAHEYAGHAQIHVDASREAVADCR
ncbi:hypothetical protein C6I20_14545 [Aeromicrobium sp. A1-2]|uniref:hypothetical protein n=1 Tax=Aeromicrobium sp. A1-2 TaxID=2107713 RepID=UPI000E54397E|nr:hypothetical protein [Aeromicrobium sp. A1-2]AXT86279.1 hypothetical protein C6I20_14545 [Aeromicrobium sp. A1-2]